MRIVPVGQVTGQNKFIRRKQMHRVILKHDMSLQGYFDLPSLNSTSASLDSLLKRKIVRKLKKKELEIESKIVPNRILRPPLAQGLCGNAHILVPVMTLIDTFLSQNKPDPNFSFAHFDACSPEPSCGGGNSVVVGEKILVDGLPRSAYDEMWCLKHPTCTNLQTLDEAFATNRDHHERLSVKLNAWTPACNKKLTMIKPVRSLIVMGCENIEEVPGVQAEIKQFLTKIGPVFAHIPVYENFLTGDFSSTNNIYLENNNYQFYDKEIFTGSHVIEIVSYNDQVPIPYWICKNTFGLTWGEQGYFKLAMYPFNQIVIPELIQQLPDSATFLTTGGAYGFDLMPDSPEKQLKRQKDSSFQELPTGDHGRVNDITSSSTVDTEIHADSTNNTTVDGSTTHTSGSTGGTGGSTGGTGGKTIVEKTTVTEKTESKSSHGRAIGGGIVICLLVIIIFLLYKNKHAGKSS